MSSSMLIWYSGWELNPHGLWPRDFKHMNIVFIWTISLPSALSVTVADALAGITLN